MSPPSLDRIFQRPERPKTLLSPSASFQVEEYHHRHQPDTPTMRYANSRDGTPVRRTGGTLGCSRTPTPGRTLGPQHTPSGAGPGALFTASMTFTPSTNATMASPGPPNPSHLIGNRADHLQQNQSDFQRCLAYKSVSALAHRDKEVIYPLCSI